MTPDLTAKRCEIASRTSTAEAALEVSMSALRSAPNRHTFVRLFDAMALAAARAVDAQHAAGAPLLALAGLSVSIKDLFDVQGQVTTAGSTVLAADAPATADAAAVARLRHAGAALMGHSNMTEFAFSGVGINPHHGTPANVATAALDATPRIPGGSSSGAAVSVATGAAWAALGSDTGGSIRIPAALHGLVGFKSTARLTPAQGCIPLSTTLDTVCAMTHSVRDAILLHEVLAQRHVRRVDRPLHAWRFGVPETALLDSLDATVARAFDRALGALRSAGAQVVPFALREIGELGQIQSTGGFSAAESWTWHRHRLAAHGAQYDPRVAARIRRGERMSAADYIDLLQARQHWIARVEQATVGFDALLTPTVPIVAPPIAELEASDDAFFAANALLLRNPSVVNMLDGCALSLPCHRPGEMPVGLMVWSSALRDDAVLNASLAIEAELGVG
ncbi:amidase [Piscinibacter sp.]|jgi:aspartyl-tRNA(Asn)/glutamyl-tRNA(Gln) amidotransferase subunit A|uniref:amidase n=1 Tax=Piscinibacter sp. TaxID=1903157 RepID=UPI00355A4A46